MRSPARKVTSPVGSTTNSVPVVSDRHPVNVCESATV